MQTIHILGQTAPACEPYTGNRIRFTSTDDRVTLVVPTVIEQNNLAWLIDRYHTTYEAYRQAGISDIMPEAGMRECIRAVLRIKTVDPNTGLPRFLGGQYTCTKYHECFAKYIETLRVFPPEQRGRMKIADRIYAPSPEEQVCIKSWFARRKNLLEAYTNCKADDIFPVFPGSDGITLILDKNPTKEMYGIIKTVYDMQFMTPTPKEFPHVPPSPRDFPPPKPTTTPYYAIGVALSLIAIASRFMK